MKREKLKKNFKKVGAAVVLSSLLILCLAGTTSAYFTDHHSTVNQFTVGKVDTELTEPKWDTDPNGKAKAKETMPNMTIVKDPQVKNIGVSDCYTFLSFRVPFVKVGTVELDGSGVLDTKQKDLFTHSVNAPSGGTPGWIQVSKTENTEEKFTEYVYAFATGSDGSTGAMEALANSETTTPLFVNEKLVMVNAVEDERTKKEGCELLESLIFNIPVREYSIQTTDLGVTEAGKTAPNDVWKIVKAQVDTQYPGMAADQWGEVIGAHTKGDDNQVH